MTNHQPSEPATEETSHVTIPASHSECANPVEAALWRALREARRERDEARREVCNLMHPTGFLNGDYARERGWDCFRQEDTK